MSLDFGDFSLEAHPMQGSYLARAHRERESLLVDIFRRSADLSSIVVDGGAHVGFFTVLAGLQLAARQGEVHAFEPDYRNFRWLEKNIARNGLESVVHLHQVALWSDAGKSVLALERGDQSTSSLAPAVTDVESIEVECVSLDQVLGEKRVGLIKLDLEGAETSALKGMANLLKNNSDVVLLVEVNPSQLELCSSSPAELLRTIDLFGLNAYEIDEKHGVVRRISPSIQWTSTVNLVVLREDALRKLDLNPADPDV